MYLYRIQQILVNQLTVERNKGDWCEREELLVRFGILYERIKLKFS